MAALVRYQPYREMVSLSDMMDQMFRNAFVRPSDTAFQSWDANRSMPIDVAENKDGYTIKASVPGYKPEEVSIDVENDVVTIRAERKVESAEESKDGDQVHWQELYYGALERCFTLPTGVDTNQAKAELEHGVLTLTLPKAESVKPKPIKVQAK